MRIEQQFADHGAGAARAVIAEHGFATIVGEDLESTHMPCVPDDGDGLAVLGHVARADPFSRRIVEGARLLLVFRGPHGYVSASWYPSGDLIPTWDHVTLEVRGRVELAPAREVLERTVDHHERRVSRPWRLRGMEDMVAKVTGFRVRADSFHLERKLHQDKPPEIREAAAAGLDAPGPYRNPALARAVRAASGGRCP